MSLRKQDWMGISVLVTGMLIILPGSDWVGYAQSSATATATAGKPLAFEVVSIRQKKEFSAGIPEVGTTADGWRMIDNGLAFVVLHAYIPQAGGAFYTNEQIVGLPGWARQESYEIHAKVSEADLPDWGDPKKQPAMLEAMLRSMLIDRCKMAAHRETKEVSVLTLVQGKGGSKFKETDPDAPHAGGVPLPGGGRVVPEDGGRMVHVYGASMSSLASLLSNFAKQPVQDKTGMTGKYDLVLPNLNMAAQQAERQGNDAASDPGPTIFSAVADLGLKLESGKGQVETLVIEHMERPTEN
jgi:uncharacterized protein (TIGR03435 family)